MQMNGTTFVFGVRINPALFEKLNQHVAENGGNRNKTILRAIENYLQNENPLAA